VAPSASPVRSRNLLRSPEFTRRFERRMPFFKHVVPPDSTGSARSFELQRLLAPVLAARWLVIRSYSSHPLIMSDVGWIHGQAGDKLIGVVVPLDTESTLLLVPQRQRQILRWQAGRWMTTIDRDILLDVHVKEFRNIVAATAQRQFFGPSEQTLAELMPAESAGVPLDPLMGNFGAGDDGVANEFAWHQLVSNVRIPPQEIGTFPIRPDVLASSWVPPIHFPTNLPQFPAPYQIAGNTISVRLHRVGQAHPLGWLLE
jgi:hypothetical protein